VGCIDVTQIGRFVEGALSSADVQKIEAHLDGCNACLEAVAGAAQGEIVASRTASLPNARRESAWVHLISALARSADPELDEPGSSRDAFGPYRVSGVLGRGGMGIVYRTTHQALGTPAAVKTVRGGGPHAVAAMRQEIAFLRGQRHPGIVAVFDDGVIDGDPWYAMELLEGSTLAALNREWWHHRDNGDELPAAAQGRLHDVLGAYSRICEPLSFVHRIGVVHCDLKPENVFVRGDGQPVLVDFGLLSRAQGAIGREVLEVGGRLRGTLPYMPPELVRGQLPDARADLYALGCMLYESVTGRPPFLGATATALLQAHLHLTPHPASSLVAGVPAALDELLRGLLAKERDERIANVDFVADNLESLLARSTRPPSSPPTPYLFRPRVVGRDDALTEFRALREAAYAGRGRMTLVLGESGIGKTFVASEIVREAAQRRFEVVTGECLPLHAGPQSAGDIAAGALQPLRNLLRTGTDRSRRPGGKGPGPFGSDRNVRVLSRYEPSLQFLLEPEQAGDAVSPLPPNAERDRVLEALADLTFGLASMAPLVLVIDDIQWADDLTLAFLEFLSGGILDDKRVLVIALCRSEEITPAIAALRRRESVSVIALGRLASEPLSTMIHDLLAGRPPEDFVRALTEQSEGNPFFVAEYLRAAAAEGQLERTPAGWKLAAGVGAGHAWALPRSLLELLERRLALLSEASQRVASTAAVLGREFDPAKLSAMSDDASSVEPSIREMLERQVVQRLAGGRLRFLHDKIREAAYARIDARRRRELHGAAARAIEAAHGSSAELDEHAAEIGYHWRSAGEAEKAIGHFEKAAARALAGSANADAVRLLRAAHEASVEGGVEIPAARRATWERQLGDALLGLGDLAGSVDRLGAALAHMGRPVPRSGLGMGLTTASNALLQVAHRLVPATWLSRRSPPGALEAARAYERLLQASYYSGDYAKLFFANLATLNVAETLPPTPTLVAAYTSAAITAGIMPMRSLAARYFRLAEEALARAHDVEVESYVRLVSGVYDSGIGRWPEALASNSRALELSERMGFHRRWEEAAGVRAWLLSRIDFAPSLEWAERLLAAAHRRGDKQMMGWGLMGIGCIHSRCGDLEALDRLLARQVELVPDVTGAERIGMDGLRLVPALASGDLATAMSTADAMTSAIRQTGPIHLHCLDAYARVAETYLKAWQTSGSRAAEAKARAALATFGRAAHVFTVARPRHRFLVGAHQWLAGRRTKAIGSWRRGVADAAALGMDYDRAWLLRAIAACAEVGSPDASRDQGGAVAIFARLSVTPDRIEVLSLGTRPAAPAQASE
jgi:eukaryotic-like serine/threonine-protein kinase